MPEESAGLKYFGNWISLRVGSKVFFFFQMSNKTEVSPFKLSRTIEILNNSIQ